MQDISQSIAPSDSDFTFEKQGVQKHNTKYWLYIQVVQMTYRLQIHLTSPITFKLQLYDVIIYNTSSTTQTRFALNGTEGQIVFQLSNLNNTH